MSRRYLSPSHGPYDQIISLLPFHRIPCSYLPTFVSLAAFVLLLVTTNTLVFELLKFQCSFLCLCPYIFHPLLPPLLALTHATIPFRPPVLYCIMSTSFLQTKPSAMPMILLMSGGSCLPRSYFCFNFLFTAYIASLCNFSPWNATWDGSAAGPQAGGSKECQPVG